MVEKSVRYNEHGILLEECYYKKGKLHGLYKEYKVMGNKPYIRSIKSFKNGSLKGKEYLYTYTNGKLSGVTVMDMVDNEIHGEWKSILMPSREVTLKYRLHKGRLIYGDVYSKASTGLFTAKLALDIHNRVSYLTEHKLYNTSGELLQELLPVTKETALMLRETDRYSIDTLRRLPLDRAHNIYFRNNGITIVSTRQSSTSLGTVTSITGDDINSESIILKMPLIGITKEYVRFALSSTADSRWLFTLDYGSRLNSYSTDTMRESFPIYDDSKNLEIPATRTSDSSIAVYDNTLVENTVKGRGISGVSEEYITDRYLATVKINKNEIAGSYIYQTNNNRVVTALLVQRLRILNIVKISRPYEL